MAKKQKKKKQHPLMCLFHPIPPFGRHTAAPILSFYKNMRQYARGFCNFLKNFRFLILSLLPSKQHDPRNGNQKSKDFPP